jgi:hypothetical protein
MTNQIEDIRFTNPNDRNAWNQVDGDEELKRLKEGIYFGQLDPNWRQKAQQVIDEQRDVMVGLEDGQRNKSLPTEILIFGGGAVILLTVLVIYKYKNK